MKRGARGEAAQSGVQRIPLQLKRIGEAMGQRVVQDGKGDGDT